MKLLWGYSEFSDLLAAIPTVKNGVVVDTNVLISATYDFDLFYEITNDFFDTLVDHQIPLYCNVNVKSEFLEIHRRIIFTEALLSFESATKLSTLPVDLAKKLASIRSNQMKREKDDRSPLRLSEADIKSFKILMLKEEKPSGNLWSEFCKEYINQKLFDAWTSTVDKFGLNFLSLRQDDQANHIVNPPDWEKAIELMSLEGASSSDAMILNMYYSSKFNAILSSDFDVGFSVSNRKDQSKVCILPDDLIGP